VKVVVILGFLLLLIFTFVYNTSITYYGTIGIRELQQNNNEYLVVVEGDFGVRKSNFNDNDTFGIAEYEDSRMGYFSFKNHSS